MALKANIGTLALQNEHIGYMSQEQMMNHVLQRLEEVEKCHLDLICLPEEVLIACGDEKNPDWKEINESMLKAMQNKAKELRCYIECCLMEPCGDKSWNTAWFIDRNGEILGKYRKRYLTFRHLGKDGLPGEDLPVFDTDIGRIGIQTCYDIGFRDGWAELANQGTDLIIWNSAYDGGSLLRAYAAHNMTFIVSSVWSDHAQIIDPLGRIIARSSRWDGWAISQVPLDMEIFHLDKQIGMPGKLRKEFGDRIVITSDSEQNVFTLSSNDSDWPVKRIKKEYGLMSYKEYHAYYAQANYEARKAVKSSVQSV